MKSDVATKEVEHIINNICLSAKIPYCDVICYKGKKELLRYVYGENATRKVFLPMYSCSKPITAFAVMMLIERGMLNLDDEVEKFIPEVKKCFLVNEHGNKYMPMTKMTVRHLLTMTAGFTYDIGTMPICELKRENPKATLQEFILAFVSSPLAFEPGKRFEYSLCYDVLAAVIEKVVKNKFSVFVGENIFKPLGMNDSFFDNRKVDFQQSFIVGRDGVIRKCGNENDLIFTHNYESGGAGLISTVNDYSKFARCLLSKGVAENGTRILSEKFVKMMSSEQIENVSVKNSFTCVQGKDYAYGFGVRVRKIATNWGLGKGEYGWDGAAGSYLMVDPVREVSVVIGMNLLNWPNVFIGKHLEIVRAIYENLV